MVEDRFSRTVKLIEPKRRDCVQLVQTVLPLVALVISLFAVCIAHQSNEIAADALKSQYEQFLLSHRPIISISQPQTHFKEYLLKGRICPAIFMFSIENKSQYPAVDITYELSKTAGGNSQLLNSESGYALPPQSKIEYPVCIDSATIKGTDTTIFFDTICRYSGLLEGQRSAYETSVRFRIEKPGNRVVLDTSSYR